jgi:transcription termination factor NusB
LIVPFFWNESTGIAGIFNEIPKSNQESFIRLFYHFTNFSSSLLKSISKCVSSIKISEDVVTLLLEVFRYRMDQLNPNIHISFCLTLLFTKPLDSVLNEVILTLKRYGIDKSKSLVHPFLQSFSQKLNQKNIQLSFVLLSLVNFFNGNIKDESILDQIFKLMDVQSEKVF